MAASSVSLSIRESATGLNLVGTVHLDAQANPPPQKGVQFYIGAAKLGQPVLKAPYTMPWDTTTVPAGTHIVKAVAMYKTRNYSALMATSTNPPGQSNNGAGFWRPLHKTYVGAQAVMAVEAGRGAMVDEITLANYPNTQLRIFYKHGGVANVSPAGTGPAARDASATVFTADDALALGTPAGAWITTTDGSTKMNASPGNGDSGAWFMDLGSSAYRAACATELVRFLDDAVARGETVNGVYLDNVCGNAPNMGMAPQTPFGYTVTTWRNAVIGWIAYVADALRTAGYYLIANMSDYYDAALGETAVDFSSGETWSRFWGQVHDYIAAHNTHPTALDQFFLEFYCQIADGSATPRPVGTSTAAQFWASWQALVARAHALNRDFGATATESGSNLDASYERASFLLDADLTRKDVLWIWNTDDSSATMTPSPNLYSNPGARVTGHNITGSLHWAQFANTTVIVNPTTSPATATILGVPRTVGAVAAIFV